MASSTLGNNVILWTEVYATRAVDLYRPVEMESSKVMKSVTMGKNSMAMGVTASVPKNASS